MKEQIIKTAYKVSAKDLSEPWYFNDVIVYADKREEAKSRGFTELLNAGAEKLKNYHNDKNTDLQYTDIRVRRVKEEDVILFEDKEVKRSRVEQLLWQKGRDEKALKLTTDFPNSLAVVRAGCYNSWWGANRSGYSDDIIFAGKYTTQEAYEIVRGSCFSRNETIQLVDSAEINDKIDKEIETLQKRIDRLNTYRL